MRHPIGDLTELRRRDVGQAADLIVTIEDHVAAGGYGSAVLESYNDSGIKTPVLRASWPDQFVEHASSVDYLRAKYGLSVDRLVADVRSQLSATATRHEVHAVAS